MEEIVTIDEIQYILTYDQPLTVEQKVQVIDDIRMQQMQRFGPPKIWAYTYVTPSGLILKWPKWIRMEEVIYLSGNLRTGNYFLSKARCRSCTSIKLRLNSRGNAVEIWSNNRYTGYHVKEEYVRFRYT